MSRLGSNVYQCFTEWGAAAPGVCEYSAHADLRSWMETKAFLTEIFSGGATGTHQTTNCTGDCSRCSGHGKCYYVPGPAPANVTGNNTNATPYDPVVCRCVRTGGGAGRAGAHGASRPSAAERGGAGWIVGSGDSTPSRSIERGMHSAVPRQPFRSNTPQEAWIVA